MPIFDPDSDSVTGPLIEGAPIEPVLEIHEIQGNILPGFGSLRQVLLGVMFDETKLSEVKSWLRWLQPFISRLGEVNDYRNLRRTAARRNLPRPLSLVWTNIVFSHRGLQLLAGETTLIKDASFKLGMAERSGQLGDPTVATNEGHPSKWKVGGSPADTPDALLIVANDDESELLRRAVEIKATIAENAGLRLIYEQIGETLDDDREHFGFRDGISQVGVRGRLSENERHYLTRRYIDPQHPMAKTHSKPGQPLVYPGQFVFGYHKQSTANALAAGIVADGGYDWMKNGSLLVFRRLKQDVGAFRQFLRQETVRLRAIPGFADLTEESLAAKIVGRHPKGTALMRNLQQDEVDSMSDRLTVNHFGFGSATPNVNVCADPFVAVESLMADESETEPEMRMVTGAPADLLGARCPLFAHIRKVNPRDRNPTDQGGPLDTLSFQMLRRGVTWGKPYPSTTEEQAADDGNRGLLFLSYQTSITNQFEILNNRWMNRKIGPESGGHDMLVGQGNAEIDLKRTCLLRSSQGSTTKIETLAHWVIPTGGGYFFAPSVSALQIFSAEI